MTDRHRILAVRVALAALITAMGAMMLAGCPVDAGQPLQPRATDVVVR
ncbi:hypothetical protein [Mycobacterium vicinigordonae]|uniref:Uncharacterized protein n=1 Tax=Mycobacterium vicinigordonae TaxID=1719132 RepID=A0A7D6HVF7_9MYCO|nr:hypothetical protein [Mycobacterium vicinigordonae]QLL05255.1 hypothetical protein H0P51_15305 [Mycobacterium vicinigordonae]